MIIARIIVQTDQMGVGGSKSFKSLLSAPPLSSLALLARAKSSLRKSNKKEPPPPPLAGVPHFDFIYSIFSLSPLLFIAHYIDIESADRYRWI